jgi:alkane 1-monooxygenase
MVPVSVGVGAWMSPWAALAVALAFQIGMALIELLPVGRHSPPAAPPSAWFRWCVRMHVPLQMVVLGIGVWVASRQPLTAAGSLATLALGVGMCSVSGSLGITFAHELGHSRSRFDRFLGWWLMASVNYSHFMVEHYRGHHPRAATEADPASGRFGESLWRFLPRTLGGSLREAWVLEAQQLHALRRNWVRSALLWATLAQLAWLVFLGLVFGVLPVLFWLVQSAVAVFLLESINYIEHYGLVRASVNGKREPFAVHHAWNADHWMTNSLIANLQRHSDHHLHASRPYAALEPLQGPQLPTGYAGCIWLAMVPPLWFKVMHARMAASTAA